MFSLLCKKRRAFQGVINVFTDEHINKTLIQKQNCSLRVAKGIFVNHVVKVVFRM